MSVLIVSGRFLRENPCRELTVRDALRARGVDADVATLGRELSGLGYAPADLVGHDALAEGPHVTSLRDFWRLVRRYRAVLLDAWKSSIPLAERPSSAHEMATTVLMAPRVTLKIALSMISVTRRLAVTTAMASAASHLCMFDGPRVQGSEGSRRFRKESLPER